MGQNPVNYNMGLTNASGQLIKTQFQSSKVPLSKEYSKSKNFLNLSFKDQMDRAFLCRLA